MIRFTIPGNPQGKARVRTVHAKGKTFSYTPEKTVLYENLIKISYWQARARPFPAGEPIKIGITAFYPIPKSTSKKKKEEMMSGKILPTKKPDIDNVVKSIMDGLNGAAYRDDSQIVTLIAKKRYSDIPRVEVSVESMSEVE